MGMETSACHADTVDNEFVAKQCPLEYRILIDTLNGAEIELDDFFLAQYFDGDYDNLKEGFDDQLIDEAYDALKKAFNEKTGLELGTVYHDAEDRGDELDGGAFSVDGVYGLTAAGEKFKDDIERKFWTTFG
jgi:hypothetical protein